MYGSGGSINSGLSPRGGRSLPTTSSRSASFLTTSGCLAATSFFSYGSSAILNNMSPMSLKSPRRIVGRRTLPDTSKMISSRGLGFAWSNMSVMSNASTFVSCLWLPPAKEINVVYQSEMNIKLSFVAPALKLPGQRNKQGTRTPPSKVVFLVPR